MLKVPVAVIGMLVTGAVLRRDRRQNAVAALVWIALALTCFNDWLVWSSNFGEFIIVFVCGAVGWYAVLFTLFALTPYICGIKRVWPWAIAAVAGPLQFAFAYRFFEYGTGRVLDGSWFGSPPCVSHSWMWLVTLAFALPAAIGVWYLVKKENVALASGDSRLATQGAAVLAFVSLVFPVQFHREWITVGWAIEGLALILLFHWIPNRRLRVVALIVSAAAFVRLALNPTVLSYHPRTHVAIWNWYLYAYGIAAICFFISAQWFGAPEGKTLRTVRHAAALFAGGNCSVSTDEYRDRRLFFDRADADVFVHWKFCPRHELHYRVVGVRILSARARDCAKRSRNSARRDRITARDVCETVLARSRQFETALSNRRVHRRRYRSDRCVFRLPALLVAPSQDVRLPHFLLSLIRGRCSLFADD